MKRIAVIIFLFLILLCFTGICAYAADDIDYITGNADFETLTDAVSDETRSLLGELGITGIGADMLFSVSFKKIFDAFFGIFTGALAKPLAAVSAVTAITLPAAAFGTLQKHKNIVELCTSGLAALTVSVGVLSLITDCASVLAALSGFTAAFAGVFCAAVSASGGAASAASFAAVNVFYESFTAFICSVLSQPLGSTVCSLAFLSCLNIYSFEERLASLVKKAYILFLGFSGAVFTGVFSLNGVLSCSADSLGLRGIKFLVSSSVPVVGGVLGESCQSVIAALSLIKNSVGVFGIITVVLTVAPVLIRLVLWIFSLGICASLSQFTGASKTASALMIFKDALTLLLATVLFSAAVFTVCVGVVITFGGG